jgi:hypothetical protein
VVLQEGQVHRPDRAVALLADDDLRLVLDLRSLLWLGVTGQIALFPVDEHDDVCILFDRAGLA